MNAASQNAVQSRPSFLQNAKKQEEEAEEQKEDEEGWVKVTRGNKGTKTRPHSEAANQKALQKELRKRKRKELLNFYSWQHRNTQKERESCCRAECIVGIMVLGDPAILNQWFRTIFEINRLKIIIIDE